MEAAGRLEGARRVFRLGGGGANAFPPGPGRCPGPGPTRVAPGARLGLPCPAARSNARKADCLRLCRSDSGRAGAHSSRGLERQRA